MGVGSPMAEPIHIRTSELIKKTIMKKVRPTGHLPVILCFAPALLSICAFARAQSLEATFKTPPSSSKPKTWMHVMSGNMSEEGLTKDVKAIHEAGIGGIMLFNIANAIPYGEVGFDSPEHHRLLRHLAAQCEKYGLSFGIHNCDGWTSSGGPWIKPENSMKTVVWSETVTDGGPHVDLPLAKPTVREGFYRDIAVIAYPSLQSEIADADARPVITSSEKKINPALLTDGRLNDGIRFNNAKDKAPWILFDYGKAHTLRSAYIHFQDRKGKAVLECSDDGVVFSPVQKLERVIQPLKLESAFDAHFKPTTARYFRLVLAQSLRITEISLKSTQLINSYASLNGSAYPSHNAYAQIAKPDPGMSVAGKSVLNLSSFMDGNGRLKTRLPEGKWTVFRFGYTSTGATNWPATKWGLGLECDKFSKEAVKLHYDSFVRKVVANARDSAPNAMRHVEIDSFEVGGQNWTGGFPAMFRKAHGYDIMGFLPVFAGRYMDDHEVTTGVIWDLNRFFCDLMTRNYYGYMAELCHKDHIQLYNEPYGHGHINPIDISGVIDVPMGEFWVPGIRAGENLVVISGARVYGKNIVSAEAFTGDPVTNWKGHPGMWKPAGDHAWSQGVNEFVFHRFVHQANTHVEPGLTMGHWGSHIDRTQHWWMNAGKAWFEYLARGTHLLQQGFPVADVLVFVGDQSHQRFASVDVPPGLNYDCTNADALINRMSIRSGKLVLPEGNSYSVLVLKNSDEMELATLKRVREIADAGIPVFGSKPKKLPGHKVTGEDKALFRKLSDHVWSLPNCKMEPQFDGLQRDLEVVGKNVKFTHRKTDTEDIYFFVNKDATRATHECLFRVSGKIPEVWDPGSGGISKIARFRREGDLTRAWINLEADESVFVVFRESAGKMVSIVDADDGNEYLLDENNGLTVVTSKSGDQLLTLSNGRKVGYKAGRIPDPIALSTSWNVVFSEGGAQEQKLFFDRLVDWKDHEDEKIKYYSGTAVYAKTFNLEEKPDFGTLACLDLGEVNVAAEVWVNGRMAGVAWTKPYKLEIGQYLLKGANRLEIRVVNQWTNRLLGDERFPDQSGGYKLSGYIPDKDSRMPDWYIDNEPMPAGPRTTFDSGGFAKRKDGDTLAPSGLLGPVHIEFRKKLKL
jgi:hypothetical protein